MNKEDWGMGGAGGKVVREVFREVKGKQLSGNETD